MTHHNHSAILLLLLPSLALAQQDPQLPAPAVVPAGTHIQLELINRLSSISSNVGDTVRAQTAFPVTHNGRIVIPAGTFLEGRLVSINPKSRKAKFQMEFDRVLFPNGYTVQGSKGEASAHLRQPLPNGAFGFQIAQPTLNPPPGFEAAKKAAIIGSVSIAALLAVGIAVAAHRGNTRREFALEPGTKFDMVLAADLTINPTP